MDTMTTNDLQFDSISLDAFTGGGGGTLIVRPFKMHNGANAFELEFKKPGSRVKHKFCVKGFSARKLVAYLALWG